jgi:hypothetical protein
MAVRPSKRLIPRRKRKDLNMENVVENNKLIAEFMEFKPIDRRKRIDQVYITEKPFLGDPILDWTAMSRDPDIDYDCNISSSEMKFNTSWDWLMPVVGKVQKLGYKSRIIDINGVWQVFILDKENHFRITEHWNENLHLAVYTVIISFIKFYNNQNK